MANNHWTRDDTISLLTMAGIIPVGIALANVADGPKVFAGVALTLAFALIAGAITWRVSRSRSAVWVETDEGGIRVRGRTKNEWIAFSKIVRASTKRSFGQMTLAIDNRTFVLGEGHSPVIEHSIPERIAEVRATPASTLATRFARGGASLDEWLARIDGGAGYREGSIDNDEVAPVAFDKNADVEVRAAAVYKLLRGHDEEAKQRIRDAMAAAASAAVESMPPLVLLAAFAGARQGDHIPGFEEAKEFLAPEDVAAAERMRETRPRIRVGDEMLAEEEAIAEEEANVRKA